MRHKDAELPEPIEDLRAGETVHGEGATLVPVYTPGHASDHLCYYLVEEGALFTGDVILGGSTTVIPADDGDLADYLDSLRRLQAMDVRRIYPAHGPVVPAGPERLRGYLEHRLQREELVLQALRSLGAATPEELVPPSYPDVKPDVYPLAQRSLLAHLGKLVKEGRVREDRGRYSIA